MDPVALKVAGPSLSVARPKMAQDGASRDSRRYAQQHWRAWYDTTEWKALRLKALGRDNWTCCQTGVLLKGKAGEPDSAVVDHVVPHRGDRALFFALGNLQAVSKAWHDGQKQRLERRGMA